MKPTPPGWPRISSSLIYPDAHEAIEWLCRALGFEVRLKVEGDGGRIEHSELVFGEGLVMVSDAKPEKFPLRRSPMDVGGVNTQSMMVYVDDVEAHCRRAREAGARIVSELATTDYGEDYWTDRGYQCEDIGGHHWWFSERLRDPKPRAAASRAEDAVEPIADRLRLVDKHIARAVEAVEKDPGASPVLGAVLHEFQRKADKSRAALLGDAASRLAREAIVEVEQAGDSANVAAKADAGANEETKKAVDLAHMGMCLLKAEGVR